VSSVTSVFGKHFWSLASTLPIIVPADFSVNNGSKNCNSSIRIIKWLHFGKDKKYAQDFGGKTDLYQLVYIIPINVSVERHVGKEKQVSRFSQSGEKEKYGYTSCGAQNQERLCWNSQQEFTQNLKSKRQANEEFNSQLQHLN
jgi:hypothetical protein